MKRKLREAQSEDLRRVAYGLAIGAFVAPSVTWPGRALLIVVAASLLVAAYAILDRVDDEEEPDR